MREKMAEQSSLFYNDPTAPVFPSFSDDDLWAVALHELKNRYPDRVMLEHARWAFEAVCEELQDSIPLKNFLRKVCLKWMWERPALPRGMVLGKDGLTGWKDIEPVNIKE